MQLCVPILRPTRGHRIRQRSSVHVMCVLGYQPPLFPWSEEPSNLPSVNEWLQRSEETWNREHIHLQRAVRRQEGQANRHRHPGPEYTPGQWAWLATRDIRLRLPCKKLSPRYVGPFQILRQITPVSFRLDLPANYSIAPTFHVSLLKPAAGPREDEVNEEADPGQGRGGIPGQRTSRLSAPERCTPVPD